MPIDQVTAANIETRYNAVQAFLGGRTSYRTEEVAHLNPPTHDEISALEVYRLHTEKPERFTAYVPWGDNQKMVTTWTGEPVAVVTDTGNWHTNNFGGKWREVRIKPDFCRWYYTGREYGSRQCVNFKRMKATF